MVGVRNFMAVFLIVALVPICACAAESMSPAQADELKAQAIKGNAEAMRQLRMAAQAGNENAQNDLAIMYQYGRGVPQDYVQALKLYHKAAEQGAAAAQYNLGVMYGQGNGVPQDFAQSLKWFLIAKAEGDKPANTVVKFLEGKLSKTRVDQAQDMARQWWVSHHPQN